MSRLTSRHQAHSDTHNSSETTTKASAAESSKPHIEGGWTKRSARTRERLQPIGADATHTVPHDSNNNNNNNNIVKQQEAGIESKSSVPPLTKRVSSGVVKEKPETANKAKEIEEERTDDITVTEGGQFLPPIK